MASDNGEPLWADIFSEVFKVSIKKKPEGKRHEKTN